MNRRLHKSCYSLLAAALLQGLSSAARANEPIANPPARSVPVSVEAKNDQRPNILFCISDDQSWPHASAYGYKAINTPAFDRVAREGILFNNCFAPSPGCSPTRASMLTGRHIWQIENAGTHASSFPKKYRVYPDMLEENGYVIGATGKAWGPGNYAVSGRDRNGRNRWSTPLGGGVGW